MFSVTAKRFQSAVKAPIQLFNLEGIYATSLYKSAVSLKQYEQSYKSLESIKDILSKDNGKLLQLISNPTLNTEERVSFVNILDKSATAPVKNFLSILAENNRLSLLPSIIADFEKLNLAHNNIVNCKVYSVEPLPSKILKRIEKAIQTSKKDIVKPNGKLVLENEIRPEVLGGLILEVNDGEKIVDLSIASRVTKLNNVLNESI
ncbi:hypothetical protein ACO0SA_000258 [Hanseniaspora valbyensis]|uniref:ATP synthase subunit 5, mitochondrial n=1 Tax=Hanseniaspora valbyensis NRRL Y-1626 TaxID=766949 RepID=A0A1B7TE98_9ASCO|nr:F1 complex, OSCP/delta subunit of ATPase [Hanseniaspora valbyensis NRRL Y-1626]